MRRAALLLVVASAALLYLNGRGAGRVERASRETGVRAQPPGQAAPDDSPEPPAEASPPRAPLPSASVPEPPPGPGEGRVVRSDTGGPADRFEADVVDGEGVVIGRIDAVRGRFALDLPDLGRVGLERCRLDGTELHRGAELERTPEGALQVTALVARSASLRVRDAVTMAPVRGARLTYETSGIEHVHPAPLLPPDPAKCVASDAEGRIRLPADRPEREAFVFAEGYAIAPFGLPAEFGGEAELLLARAGGVRVRLRSVGEARESPLCLAAVDGETLLLWAPFTSEGSVDLGGMHEGRWELFVMAPEPGRRYGRFGSETCIARAEVRIEADEWQELVLDAKPLRRFVAAGDLRLPPGLDAGEVAIAVRSEDGDWVESWEDRSPGRIGFRFPATSSGRYVLEARRFLWGVPIPVAEGSGPLAVTMPDPVEVTVRVVADETGDAIPDATLEYGSAPGSEIPLENVESDLATGVYPLRVVPCRIRLIVSAPGRVGETGEIDASKPGPREATFRLRRAGAIRVRVLAGGEQPLDCYRAEVRLGFGYVMWGTPEAGEVVFDRLVPGGYDVDLNAETGFEDPEVELRHVDLRPGETVEVLFDLRR